MRSSVSHTDSYVDSQSHIRCGMSTAMPARRPAHETKQATRDALIAAGLEEIAAHGARRQPRRDLRAREPDARRVLRPLRRSRRAPRRRHGARARRLRRRARRRRGRGRRDGDPHVRRGGRLARAAPGADARSGLRLQHLLEACRRSPQIGDAYRDVLIAGRDRFADALASEGRADVLLLAGLGAAVMLELEMPIDLPRVGETVVRMLG